MIKDMESTYVPNERKNKWIKLKPEYVDGVGDDLDLIILGVCAHAHAGCRRVSRLTCLWLLLLLLLLAGDRRVLRNGSRSARRHHLALPPRRRCPARGIHRRFRQAHSVRCLF